MNKLYLLPLLFAFSPFSASANSDVAPIIYNRVVLKLIPKPEAKVITVPSPLPDPKPALSAKEQAKDKEAGKKKNELNTKASNTKPDELTVSKVAPPPADDTPAPPPPRTPIDFTVEIKGPDFLSQTDFITHTTFGEHEGLLISIDPAAVANVSQTHMVGASDVVFINEDGLITRIAPNLDLGTLNEEVSSGGPVRAILYLKPGSVQQDRITPGDHFENGIFKTHPIIMQ